MPIVVRGGLPTQTFSSNGIAQHIAAVPRCHDNDNPLWLGPCATGPLGGVTQSMIHRFIADRERFRLKYIVGLEPHDRWNKSIGYGNMWHVCEEAHAADLGANGIVTALYKHVTEQCRLHPMQLDEITKWHSVCCVQFPEYVKYWAAHPDVKNRTPLAQERVFDVLHELPSRRTVRLRGKTDSEDLITDEITTRLTRNGSGIYLQENKTKGDIDKQQVERQLKFDLQTMMYLIAMRHDWPSYEVLGVRYNVVRRPLSGGKGNIQPHKGKCTKPTYSKKDGRELRPSKITPAETSEQFYERLRRGYIAAEPDYWFFRVRSEVSADDVRVFRQTCLNPLLEAMCDWYEWTIDNNAFSRDGYPNRKISANGLHYRTPFGGYNPLTENGATEYDNFIESGSEAGLRRVETLFGELQ